ncbi:hypothetical protein [Natronomonas sp. EA1]|uniref:hypothetical protein n=1 Tax=Natronomonas sp. EA1 TaxID=3421655 RepID=UPI003EBC8B59
MGDVEREDLRPVDAVGVLEPLELAEAFLARLAEAAVPIYYVPGNHDHHPHEETAVADIPEAQSLHDYDPAADELPQLLNLGYEGIAEVTCDPTAAVFGYTVHHTSG